MSPNRGLPKLTGGIAKRKREQWERLAAGWPCALVRCDEPGAALIFDWTGQGRPVCTQHARAAVDLGYRPTWPDQAQPPTHNPR